MHALALHSRTEGACISVLSVMPVFEMLRLVSFELLALMCVILYVFACESPLSTLGRLKFRQRTSQSVKKGTFAYVPMYSVPT